MNSGGQGGRPVIVIIGGGITGLSAAYYVMKMCRDAGVEADIRLYESGPRLGGKIETLHRDGFVIERGPDSFLARKLPIIDLTRELGLEQQLTGTNPHAKKTYIVNKGKLRLMPPGLVLGIPTRIAPFVRTDLLSVAGKVRAAMDFILPRRKAQGDEALGDFLERRLGKEVLDNIAEPLLAGIYAGDTHRLSLQATFPQFQQAEQNHRSLILGIKAGGQTAGKPTGLPEAARNSVFLTYKQGLATLVSALVNELQAGGVRLMTGTGVEQLALPEVLGNTAGDLQSAAYGGRQSCRLKLSDGGTVEAAAVVMALPTYAAASLLPGIPEMKALDAIDYVSVANIVMAFRKSDIARPLDGSGLLVPRKEKRTITACTWTSSKWLHTCPPDKALLRCYVGRSGEQEWQRLSDDELARKVRDDLRDLIGITAEPLFTEIRRLPRSMPQYPVGHLQTVARARQAVTGRFPGLCMTGAGFHGVGIPDCIRQGKESAEQIFTYVSGNS